MSTSLVGGGASSEARDDSEVDEGEARGLSNGEMLAEEVGVESTASEVANRRRAVPCGRGVVDMVKFEEDGS